MNSNNRPNWSKELGILVRYGGAGVLNTAIGLLATFSALIFGASAELANISGFTAGFVFAFFIMKNFVFQVRKGTLKTVVSYCIAFIISFGLNIVVLKFTMEMNVNAMISQLTAMGAYTTAMFLLSRFFVFRTSKA